MSGSTNATTIRVVTQNLWGRRGDWPERRSVIIDGLRELRPDLVAFQEAIVTDEYDQVLDLLGTDYDIVHQTIRESDGQGISIASRWPIGEYREVELHLTERTEDFACTTLVATVAAPAPFGPLLFVNHLPSWQLAFEREREMQAVAAASFIEGQPDWRDAHVIVAGDFDADPNAASIRFWTGRQSLDGVSVCYRDAWERVHPNHPGHTLTPDNPLVADPDWPFGRIDYILIRCGLHGGPTLAITACERIFDQPVNNVWASDHFGLVADLAIPERQTPA